MEELGYSWNIYANHDFGILSDYLWWAISAYDYGKRQIVVQINYPQR